jgi:putative restriction endonuclease
VLCLCPNHHALFDNGGIYITEEFKVHNFEGSYLGPLTKHSKHAIGLDYLRYHRELWWH